jgi:hypothetical protein
MSPLLRYLIVVGTLIGGWITVFLSLDLSYKDAPWPLYVIVAGMIVVLTDDYLRIRRGKPASPIGPNSFARVLILVAIIIGSLVNLIWTVGRERYSQFWPNYLIGLGVSTCVIGVVASSEEISRK